MFFCCDDLQFDTNLTDTTTTTTKAMRVAGRLKWLAMRQPKSRPAIARPRANAHAPKL